MLKRREIRKAILGQFPLATVQSHLTGAITVVGKAAYWPNTEAMLASLLAMFPNMVALWSKDSLTVHVTFPETASHTVNGKQATLWHESKLEALKAEAVKAEAEALAAFKAKQAAEAEAEAALKAAEQATEEEAASMLAAVEARLAEAEAASLKADMAADTASDNLEAEQAKQDSQPEEQATEPAATGRKGRKGKQTA
jgi:hypothetical protein